MSILGYAASIYRFTLGNHIVKMTAACGSLLVSIHTTLFMAAVENPQGFNQLAKALITYSNTGNWLA